MRHHQDRGAAPSDFLHPPVAFGLKKHISHREGLVHNQNLRLHVNGQSEGQADEHTAGIGFYRLVHKVADFRKIQNFLQFGIHLLPGVAHHGAVHVNILNAGIIHIKTRPQLQKGGNLPVYLHRSRCGGQNSGNNL